MSDNDERIINELSAMRKSMESMKETIEDRFEMSLRPIERGLRAITLVPLALIFGGLSTWLFYMGKITESTWFWLTLFLMTPFFGEGARAILDKLPLRADAAQKAMTTLKVLFFAFTMAGLLSSCSSLDRYERTYTASYDADTSSGAVSVTLKPVNPPHETGVVPKVYVSDEEIARIVKLVTEQRAAPLITPDLATK